MDYINTSLLHDLHTIQSRVPVVLNLTNLVAMDLTANALLALGASPIMAQTPEELSELVQISNAVVINIGTLNSAFIESVHIALNEAQKWNKPVVFDPVGAGASELRTITSHTILKHPALRAIRGNASEINALFANQIISTKGVDSVLSSHDVFLNAKEAAQKNDFVITMSGATDFVFSKTETASIAHGDSIMTRVTAMGCSATALMGAFLGVNSNVFEASVHAMIIMGIAGEIAKKNSSGPGSFRVQFLDALANINSRNLDNLNVKFL